MRPNQTVPPPSCLFVAGTAAAIVPLGPGEVDPGGEAALVTWEGGGDGSVSPARVDRWDARLLLDCLPRPHRDREGTYTVHVDEEAALDAERYRFLPGHPACAGACAAAGAAAAGVVLPSWPGDAAAAVELAPEPLPPPPPPPLAPDPPFDPWFDPPPAARPLPPTLREHAITVRTAAFVAAAAGARTELALRAAHAGNPAFGFLDPADARHAYYAWWRDVALAEGVPQAPPGEAAGDEGGRSPSPAAGLATLVGDYWSDRDATPEPVAAARAQGPLPRPEGEEERGSPEPPPPAAVAAAAAKRAKRLAAARALAAEKKGAAAASPLAAELAAAVRAAAAGTDADRERVVRRVRDALMSLDGG